MRFEWVICFVALSLYFSSTEMPLSVGAVEENNNFIVSLNNYLDRSSIVNLIIPFRDYLSLCFVATTKGVLATQTDSWAWQDFFVLHVMTHRSVHTTKKQLQQCVEGISFQVPGIGDVTVIGIEIDKSLRSVADVLPESMSATSQARRRWRPRTYFGLHSDFKWTGKGVRISFLDTGLHPDVRSSNSLKSCTSFVPGIPCENDADDHGLFSVSVATSMQFSNVCHNMNSTSYTNYVGVAPLAQVHMMRVFDYLHQTRTSWCVAALNAALQWGSDIINLSFGGDDYYDTIFTDKISAAAAAGVVIVAATGNDGPHFGSVHNPADHAEVLAVGSLGAISTEINTSKRSRWVSVFSGRGPTTWELPFGVGRVRPDVVALGEYVFGVGFTKQQCNKSHTAMKVRVGHGTSVAAPIVAGIAALCIEAMRQLSEPRHASRNVNIALMKRLFMETADELQPNMEAYQALDESISRAKNPRQDRWWRRGKNKFPDQMDRGRGFALTQTMMHFRKVLHYSRMSQGTGEVSPLRALNFIERIYNNVEGTICEIFAFPNMIDATSSYHLSFLGNETAKGACEIHWPYCEQPLFPSATLVAFNITLHYPRCESAHLSEIHVTVTGSTGWAQGEYSGGAEEISLETTDGLLLFRAVSSPVIASYTGWLSLFAISPANATFLPLWKKYGLVVVTGYVNGTYTCSSVNSDNWCKGELGQGSRVSVPFKIPVIPRPARAHRLVFDVSHQWFYPPDFVPSDNARRETFKIRRRRHHNDFRRHQSYNSFFEQLSDHPHTNMAPLFLYLRRIMGFYVEIPLISHFFFKTTSLTSSWSELTRKYYRRVGTLILMDSELPFTAEERRVIEESVRHHRLHLLIVSEWYSENVARGLSFYDTSKDRFMSPVDDFEKRKNKTLDSFGGLKGACHVPSLNALLHSVSEGMLQLDESHVIDGKILLQGNDHSYERYFGRLSSAGILRRFHHTQKTSNSNTEANLAMICGVANTWVGGLHYLEKLADVNDTLPKQDLMISVPLNTFIPVFGFVGVGHQSRKHRHGRVSLVSDSDCLSDSTDMLSSIGILDRIIREISLRLLNHDSLSNQELVVLDNVVAGLVHDEEKYPSLCLYMIQDMLHFLYTGDGSRFHSGAHCEMSTLEVIPLEKNVNTTESINEESDVLLQRLLSAAPGRVAVAALIREVSVEILTASGEQGHYSADEGFLENHHPVLNSNKSFAREQDKKDFTSSSIWSYLTLSLLLLVLFIVLAVVVFFFFFFMTKLRGPTERLKQD